MLYPTVLEETNSSYRIFCGWGRPNAKSKASFVPAVLNIDKEGNLMELNIPYDITKSNEKEISSFLIQSFSALWASLPINNKFYHPFVYNFVKVDENKAETRLHLIITYFDTLGKVVWRKGYDTIANFGDNLLLFDSRITKDGNILLLLRKDLDKEQISILQILEVDTSGNIIKKIECPLEIIEQKAYNFSGKGIIKTENDSYIVLAELFFDDYSLRYFLKINQKGEVINKFPIPNKNLRIRVEFFERAPNGFLYAFGTTLIDASENPIGSFGYKDRVYICRIDEDFRNFEDFEFYEHIEQNTTSFIHLHFLNENEFIGVGYKDRFKLYVARILWETPSSVNYSNTNSPIFFKLENNRLILVSDNLKGKPVQVYSVLGTKLIDIEYKEPIDISGFASGLYFIKIGKRFIDKFFKN